jgi:RNA polymerase sigma-70 factor (ECF subfamily)
MLGCREMARDVVQESFLRLARDGRSVSEEETARRWLFIVVRNLCASHYRTSRRVSVVGLETVGEPPSLDPNPREIAIEKDLNEFIERGVAQLPYAMRETLILREYENLTYAQIAEVQGCPIGTVRSRLAAARANLCEILEPYLEAER